MCACYIVIVNMPQSCATSQMNMCAFLFSFFCYFICLHVCSSVIMPTNAQRLSVFLRLISMCRLGVQHVSHSFFRLFLNSVAIASCAPNFRFMKLYYLRISMCKICVFVVMLGAACEWHQLQLLPSGLCYASRTDNTAINLLGGKNEETTAPSMHTNVEPKTLSTKDNAHLKKIVI